MAGRTRWAQSGSQLDMRIISVDGGGYLGLATASFLQAVEQRQCTTAAARFDLFCGTSTGAIIALALVPWIRDF